MYGIFFFLYIYSSDFYSMSYQTSLSMELVLLFLNVLMKHYLIYYF